MILVFRERVRAAYEHVKNIPRIPVNKPYAVVGVVAALVVGGGIVGWFLGAHMRPTTGIPPRTVADYLHAVIEADRTFYTQHVVERMEAMLIVTASERWREEQALPLPAQFLQEASRNLGLEQRPFRYRLISLWPINPKNAPESERERHDLEQVVKYGEVVENTTHIDGRLYFRAIYPDRAVSRACISCHNAHERSPKRDFKLNDIMGGLEILIPLS
ncbi:MAG: DUF3365 domain-containing protein [Nitrospirae bacterium]|nr:MAG: DUF3365 domain-containing protein [Nitrospirota bacterium]